MTNLKRKLIEQRKQLLETMLEIASIEWEQDEFSRFNHCFEDTIEETAKDTVCFNYVCKKFYDYE